jgi:hypothetical protein
VAAKIEAERGDTGGAVACGQPGEEAALVSGYAATVY